MHDYILFMHGDAADRAVADDGARWNAYIAKLRQSGQFDGGSSIGTGEGLNQGKPAAPASTDITGFIRVRAESLDDAKRFLVGNPVYEGGGTVEIRELLRD